MRDTQMIALDIGATKVACAVAKHGEILGTGVVAYPARSASWAFCAEAGIASRAQAHSATADRRYAVMSSSPGSFLELTCVD